MRTKFRVMLCSICLGLFVAVVSVHAQEHPDFSGRWVLDKDKSKDLPWLNLKEYSMVVSYNRGGEQLSVKTRIWDQPVPYKPHPGDQFKFLPVPLVEAIYTIDGPEVTVHNPAAPVEVKQNATWRGEKLELRNQDEWTGAGKRNRWTTIDVWQLAPDGKTLTVQQSIESVRGTQTETLVFVKQ